MPFVSGIPVMTIIIAIIVVVGGIVGECDRAALR